MNDQPSTNGETGRLANGQFGPGNKLGKGNPFNRQACQLRAALFRAVDADGMEKAAAAVLEKAYGGDVGAFRELCNRTLGLPSATEVLDRLAAIEARLFGDE